MADNKTTGGNSSYMLHGRLRSTTGEGDTLASILSEQERSEPMLGCRLYLVARDPQDADALLLAATDLVRRFAVLLGVGEQVDQRVLEVVGVDQHPQVVSDVDEHVEVEDLQRPGDRHTDQRGS